jgi:Methylase involved in ubiquinone/menaquinone biosynthesis
MTFSQNQEISKSYYDEVYYANVKSMDEALTGRLHFYKIKKVFQLYTPGKNERVVDLGSAWGAFSFELAPYCKQTIGVDFSETATKFCIKRLRTSASTNLSFVCADAQNTGLKPGSIDSIFCSDLVEHLYPDQFTNTLDECKRMLRPGGKLVIWTPHRGHILERMKNNNILLKRDPAHVDYKSMRTIVDELEKREFKILKNYYTESHLPVWKYIERIGMPFIPLLRRRIAILAEKQK